MVALRYFSLAFRQPNWEKVNQCFPLDGLKELAKGLNQVNAVHMSDANKVQLCNLYYGFI